MNIGEIAKLAELPVKTVRYYADIGLVSPLDRTEKGYRQYDRQSLQKLIFVRRARGFGFSVDECRELLSLYENKERHASDVKRIASKRLEEIEQKQIELQMLHDELAYLVQNCKGGNRPDCPIIDGLSSTA